MDLQYDVVIVGAGPSGLTAAIYAQRAGLKTAILESSAPGGKLIKTYSIENYPGIKKINGADLAYQMFDHAQSLNAEYLYGNVQNIIDHGDYKEVITDVDKYMTKAVIVATGTIERTLGLKDEDKFTGRGVSYCAVCDGAFYKNKDVVVIGGGNSALEESIYLTQFVNHIYIVIRRDVFRADKVAQEKVRENKKISIITKHVPVKIIGDDTVEGIVLKDVDTNEEMQLKIQGIFPYIGAIPSTQFLDKSLLNDKGYIKVNEFMETSIDGIYGAGDVIDKDLRQVVTACNDGAIAAQRTFKYIKN